MVKLEVEAVRGADRKGIAKIVNLFNVIHDREHVLARSNYRIDDQGGRSEPLLGPLKLSLVKPLALYSFNYELANWVARIYTDGHWTDVIEFENYLSAGDCP